MGNYLTNEDVQNYGSELVDFARRAAVDALAPTLQQIEQQNAELQRRLAVEARKRLDAEVAQALPDFRQRDADARWHDWLREKDALSGVPRQSWLNDAIQQGDANRVVNVFRGFEREHGRQGDSSPTASAGRGEYRRTASMPSGRVYSRAEIARLYDQHRRGAYAGKEAEWARQEADIIRASAEGRIAGGVDVAGK